MIWMGIVYGIFFSPTWHDSLTIGEFHGYPIFRQTQKGRVGLEHVSIFFGGYVGFEPQYTVPADIH